MPFIRSLWKRQKNGYLPGASFAVDLMSPDEPPLTIRLNSGWCFELVAFDVTECRMPSLLTTRTTWPFLMVSLRVVKPTSCALRGILIVGGGVAASAPGAAPPSRTAT